MNNPDVTLTLLIIQDDREFGEFTSKCLQGFFSKILLATSFPEALKTILEEEPDIIITDQNVNGGYIIDALRIARSQGVNSLALVQTGNPSFELAREALHLGYVELIEKPVSEEVLKLRVRQMILHEHERRGPFGKNASPPP